MRRISSRSNPLVARFRDAARSRDASGTLLLDGEHLIEEAGVIQHSYTAPGTDHEVLITPELYDLVVDDVALVDWVAALVDGEPVADVHCEDCGP